jgi:hypothetical protein
MKKFTREITDIEDLTPKEQNAVLNSLYQKDIPFIPVTLRFLKENYERFLNIDFSKVKEEDLGRKHALTMRQAVYMMTHDYEALRTLGLCLSNKVIYAKSYEALVKDKDHMNMELDETRERCKMEAEEQERLKELEGE